MPSSRPMGMNRANICLACSCVTSSRNMANMVSAPEMVPRISGVWLMSMSYASPLAYPLRVLIMAQCPEKLSDTNPMVWLMEMLDCPCDSIVSCRLFPSGMIYI